MKYIFFILFTLTIVSCSENDTTDSSKKKTEKKELGDFKKTENLPSCACSELEKDTINQLKLLNSEKFTGICFSHYPNDTSKVMEEIQYLEGKIHGYYRVYSVTDGKMLTENQYKNGKPIGTNDIFNCDCDDLEIEKMENSSIEIYTLNGREFTGVCEKYMRDDKMKILDMEFVDGLRNGNSIYYDQYGDPITADVYKEGVFVTTIVYTDNENEESK